MRKLMFVVALVAIALYSAQTADAQGYWYPPQPRPVRVDPYTGNLYDATAEIVVETNAALAAHQIDSMFATLMSGPRTPAVFAGVAPQYRRPAPASPRPMPVTGPAPEPEQRSGAGSVLYINKTNECGPGCDFPVVFYHRGYILRGQDGTPVQLLPGGRATLPGDNMILAIVVGEAHCEIDSASVLGGAVRVIRNLPANCRDIRQ